MLYEISGGTVSAGGRQILSHIDFAIRGKEKIGIVGANGAGKTTLLNLIAGNLEPDRDDKLQAPCIRTSRAVTIKMLSQTRQADLDRTVEEILHEGCPFEDQYSREKYEYEIEYDRLFTGLGFKKEQKEKKLREFSGGEQTKISLIRLLLDKPDILLLDEPTNHLDLDTTAWLEGYMKEYPNAMVMVSHDRFFLDQTVSVIYEVHHGKLTRYAGNYSAFRVQKQKDLEAQSRAYIRQQEEIRRLNDLIRTFKTKPRKAAFARSRKSILERMEKIEKPEEENFYRFTKDIEPLIRPGKWMLEAKDLTVGYDKAILTLSLRVRAGQKIGIIGSNGAGKTTFLKTAAGILPPMKGKCILSDRAAVGYFDQQAAELVSDKTVAEHFHNLFPVLTEKDLRQILGHYLFAGRDAMKKVSDLSGGEKARLLLAELLESRPNLLLLDEPTNHMDIHAKETLESAFQSYKGTILFVSHDRYFIRQVADALLIFEEDGVLYYPFDYDHYLERKGRGKSVSMTGMLRSEDQRLIEGLRAVPEKEKGMLREIRTAEAERDWLLRLASEDLAEAESRMRSLWEESQTLASLSSAGKDSVSADGGSDGMLEVPPEEEIWSVQRAVEEQMDDACKTWTEACIRWAEKYGLF